MLRPSPFRFLIALALGSLIACGEDEPPPPSTAPVISQATIACAEAQGAPYEYSYEAIERVEVTIEDAERDLVPGSIRGEVGGYPMRALTDEDADGIFSWTPPAALGPMVCRGPIAVRVEAVDLDENRAELNETVTK